MRLRIYCPNVCQKTQELNFCNNMLNSYPKIYNLGHSELVDLFNGPVIVEEKIDGSQISFGVTNDDELLIRSKGCSIDVNYPPKMFKTAVDNIMDIRGMLVPGAIYRGEYLAKPKHNTLKYSRVPLRNIIIFDIEIPNDTGCLLFASPSCKLETCRLLGMECVPVILSGENIGIDLLKAALTKESVLGGVKIEGVVIKPLNYDLFGRDKKVIMGKHVSEEFKEVHQKEWKTNNPGRKDSIEKIIERFRTTARWEKAFQHLRESGKIENSPKDIDALIKETQEDISEECSEEIKNLLYQEFGKEIKRRSTFGLPEWYKNKLLEAQFS